jgi:chromosomal replication initiator protein
VYASNPAGKLSAKEAWDIARSQLRLQMTKSTYDTWVRDTVCLAIEDNAFVIGCPNAYAKDWLSMRLRPLIKRTLVNILGHAVEVSFVVQPASSAPPEGAAPGPLLEGLAPDVVPMIPEMPEVMEMPAIEGTSLNPRYTFANFIVGPSNELAFNAARALIREQQSPFNPLFIHGGCGVGKTHLLQGICNGVAKVRPQTQWLYLSAEEFANQFVLALKTKKLEAFRRRMRQTDLLAIDDVHFLASKPSTQEEFLHTFNTISLAGKQVVLVSDAHPKMIAQLSEKLVNRFVSGMVVKIEAPDFHTRCEICRQYARRMMKVSPGGIESKRIAEVPETVGSTVVVSHGIV